VTDAGECAYTAGVVAGRLCVMDWLTGVAESAFKPVVLVFTVANLASMGLRVELPAVLRRLRDARFALLVLCWGWVVGPALGLLITRVLPLAEPYATVVLITSLAPCAPFLPPVVERARGDLAFAGAFIPLAAAGTVVFKPLMAPLLVPGLTLSAAALAVPLLVTVLLPLALGAVVRTNAPALASAAYRPVQVLAAASTVLTAVLCVALYARPMWATAGSLALLAMTLFMLTMGGLAWRFGFGLGRAERAVLCLGMGTRNIAAVFAAVLAIPEGDPRMVATVVMWTLWSFVLAQVAALLLGRGAPKSSPESPR
jgi:BASS family bile acid:Na+ symporter